MAEKIRTSVLEKLSLPEHPNLNWLRQNAKRLLKELRKTNPSARLADAQFELSKRYGFSNWRAFKANVDSRTVDGQLIEAARTGDSEMLVANLDRHPKKLHLRIAPYDWTLLHTAANSGQLAAVDLLLKRGIDANTREKGDNTYAIHWAAAAGHLEVVRRLADAGGDVVGLGDDHELEVIGWAVGWDTGDDARHRAVADFLVSRGARHHIFSAIAADLPDVIRDIVNKDPSALSRRMSRNENHQLPLHYAIQRKRPAIVSLLLDLGADPLAVDGSGFPAAGYATAPGIDRPVMERIRTLLLQELDSAVRGHRHPRIQITDFIASVALGEWELSAQILHGNAEMINLGVLHLMAKRNDLAAARWLLGHGADPNARWAHWDAQVTPLHLAILGDHISMVRLLLNAGADPAIQDSKHHGDALGWARFFRRTEIVALLESRT